MTNLTETTKWEAGIFQIDTTDPVIGGAPDAATKQGLPNIAPQQLANRTSWLREAISAYTAIEGVSVAHGRYVWSSDGALMVNQTGATVVITGTTRAALIGKGFWDAFEWLRQAAVSVASPVAAVQPFAIASPPAGWLECDGSAVSRTSYDRLFQKIGTAYGPGDGSKTFNVPDLRGEFIRAWDHGRGVDAGRVFGSPQAASEVFDGFGTDTIVAPRDQEGVKNPDGRAGRTVGVRSITASTQDSRARVFGAVRPRNIALLLCIKY